MFPSNGSYSRQRPSLPRVPSGRFPGFIGTIRCSDSRHSFRLRSFLVAQAYHLSARSVRSCRQRTLQRQAWGIGLRLPPYRCLCSRWRTAGLPGPWGALAYMPCSLTPAGRERPGLYGLPRAAFRRLENVGSRKAVISGLNHTACTLAVYASRPRSHETTQDSLPAGGQPLPDGISTRRAPCAISGRHPSPTFPSAQVFLAHQDLTLPLCASPALSRTQQTGTRWAGAAPLSRAGGRRALSAILLGSVGLQSARGLASYRESEPWMFDGHHGDTPYLASGVFFDTAPPLRHPPLSLSGGRGRLPGGHRAGAAGRRRRTGGPVGSDHANRMI